MNPTRSCNIVNIYAPNIGAPKYIKHILTDIKGEMDSNTMIVGNLNAPLTSMDRSSRQKINKEYWPQITQIDLIDKYRAFHWKAADYTLFSRAHETVSTENHMFGHKTILSKFKKTEIISSIFSDHNTMRLEIITRKKCKKCKYVKSEQYTTKQQMGHWRSQRGNFLKP